MGFVRCRGYRERSQDDARVEMDDDYVEEDYLLLRRQFQKMVHTDIHQMAEDADTPRPGSSSPSPSSSIVYKHPLNIHYGSYKVEGRKDLGVAADDFNEINKNKVIILDTDQSEAVPRSGDQNPPNEINVSDVPGLSEEINTDETYKMGVGSAGVPGESPLLAMTSHFHIPHFGMMDPADFPRRAAIDSSHSAEGTFLWAVGLFGTVENGAIVLTALFSRKCKRPLHMLVGSLATTDLFVCLVYIPSYTYFLLGGDRDFVNQPGPVPRITELAAAPPQEAPDGYTYCEISRAIFIEIASVTLTIKALIALYLYVLTRSKEFANRYFSTRNTLIFITAAWMLNFVILFIPVFFGYSKVDFYPNAFVCIHDQRVEEGFWSNTDIVAIYTFATLGVHLVELLFTCYCFIQVHKALMRGKIISRKSRKDDKEAHMNYTRATKITILVFISFCVCWLPIYVINMADPARKSIPHGVHRLAMDLLLLKSSINPTIYICGIRSLRHELKLLCLCKCRAKDGEKLLKLKPPESSSFGDGSADTVSGGV